MVYDLMSLTVSSYIRTASGTDTRALDSLQYNDRAFRPQASTWYVRFIELGTVLLGSGIRVWSIGINNSPELYLAPDGNGVYQSVHDNDNSSVTATLSAGPSVGDIVELVVQLNADGSLVLIQSINGAASTTTSATSALTLASAWSNTALRLNRRTASGGVGFIGFMNLVIVRGVHSLARMRRFAGVKQ